MRSLLFFLPLGLWLAATPVAQAQGIATETSTDKDRPEAKPKGVKVSLAASGALAFSGFNSALTVELQRGRHALYLGPKVSLADSYLPGDAPLGLTSGYKFYFLPDYNCVGRFGFFLDLNYQFQAYKAFNRDGSRSKKLNDLHEFFAAYGLEYRLSNRWRVNNEFGFGRYVQRYYNTSSADTYQQSGYNRLVRVELLYTFN